MKGKTWGNISARQGSGVNKPKTHLERTHRDKGAADWSHQLNLVKEIETLPSYFIL